MWRSLQIWFHQDVASQGLRFSERRQRKKFEGDQDFHQNEIRSKMRSK